MEAITADCQICGKSCLDQSGADDGFDTSFCGDAHEMCCRAWWWKNKPDHMMDRFAKVPISFIQAKARLNMLEDEYIKPKMPKQSLSLRIHGPIGTGKTFAAVAHAHAWVQARLGTMESTERIFDNKCKSTMKFIYPREYHNRCLLQASNDRDPKDRKVKEIEDTHRNTGLLIIDDLFAEKETDASQSRILSLVNYRESNLLPTVITTNLTIEEINNKDPRLASRIYQWENIQMLGDDRRLA